MWIRVQRHLLTTCRLRLHRRLVQAQGGPEFSFPNTIMTMALHTIAWALITLSTPMTTRCCSSVRASSCLAVGLGIAGGRIGSHSLGPCTKAQTQEAGKLGNRGCVTQLQMASIMRTAPNMSSAQRRGIWAWARGNLQLLFREFVPKALQRGFPWTALVMRHAFERCSMEGHQRGIVAQGPGLAILYGWSSKSYALV